MESGAEILLESVRKICPNLTEDELSQYAFNHDFVVSEIMKETLPKDVPVTYKHQGEIFLRGKAQPMKLYTVDFNF